ncbi:hypothetical protein EDD37DRAFT_625776 [Exophiala viscosa]|uniref:uncharacterized protein n=1 Tax=Exophiala viscosa TaxID=2486360 RepID=UPI002199E9D5|nr:hypothetical protein EDD37DRAFT_625776 [Exophiala viscosa]
MDHLYPYPKMGSSFLEILQDSLTRKLLGFEAIHAEKTPFISGVTSRLKFLLQDALTHLSFMKIGYTALEAFLQSNCTGPPLDFDPETTIIPEIYHDELETLRRSLFEYLAVDGIRPYHLTPHIELFWLAQVIFSNPALAEEGFNGRRARFRLDFWHQKLFSEESPTLRDRIYADAEVLERQLSSRVEGHAAAAEEHFVEFLVERAVVRTYYGDDALARTDLARAAGVRDFQFALTGALGKRTKYQGKETSQLVVLARSRDGEVGPDNDEEQQQQEKEQKQETNGTSTDHTNPLDSTSQPPSTEDVPTRPTNLPLNDDTLLEQIRFNAPIESSMTKISESLPETLASLDPAAPQPLLSPVDSIILLATASSITNTSPDDGLIREETLPYATRVLEGGSSNWQVYTQALLVRSRIEGYRSRTAERGLLQLQALVDQVVAETTPSKTEEASESNTAGRPTLDSTATTFLPRPKPSESATPAERLKYIYQLSPPYRWELEAELAARWTHMGGLKTALEIYERLHMHAEVALCLAATDREAEATKLLRGLVFDDTSTTAKTGEESLRKPSPADTPRLLSILGDFDGQPEYYNLAWTVSGNRYARAQRSLARYHAKRREFQSARDAYLLALGVSRIDRQSWFALGCTQLELEDYLGAVQSFTRCVQLEDDDAQAWSNLAISLLKLPKPTVTPIPSIVLADEDVDNGDDGAQASVPDPYQHVREALRALRRAATLKRDDARIWDNYLTVAASLPPHAGTPWAEIVQAMGRVIELRAKKEGEGAVDLAIFKVLVEYITSTFAYPTTDEEAGSEEATDVGENTAAEAADANDDTNPAVAPATDTGPGKSKLPHIARAFLSLVDTQIVPLATSSSTLYELLADVSLWRRRPAQALLYAEKSWRAFLTQVSAVEEFDNVSEKQWGSVVDKTIWLMRKYRDLGPTERERTGGQVEAKWRFKAKSAARRVLGRGKAWEGGEAWERLKGEIDELKE